MSDFTKIGEIINTHGVRGEMKVYPSTPYPESYLDIRSIYFQEKGELVEYEVEKMRVSKNLWLLKVVGVDDMDTVQALKKTQVFLPDEELVPLDEDEFFIHQLMDADVYSSEGELLGKVVDYFETAANGVCEVKGDKGTFLFPTTREVLLEIIPEESKLVIEVLPGMIED